MMIFVPGSALEGEGGWHEGIPYIISKMVTF